MAALAASRSAIGLGQTSCLLCKRTKRQKKLQRELSCAPESGAHLFNGKKRCCRPLADITAQRSGKSVDGGGGGGAMNGYPVLLKLPDQQIDQCQTGMHVRGAPIEATRRVMLQAVAVIGGSLLSSSNSISLAGEATVDARHMSNDFAVSTALCPAEILHMHRQRSSQCEA